MSKSFPHEYPGIRFVNGKVYKLEYHAAFVYKEVHNPKLDGEKWEWDWLSNAIRYFDLTGDDYVFKYLKDRRDDHLSEDEELKDLFYKTKSSKKKAKEKKSLAKEESEEIKD